MHSDRLEWLHQLREKNARDQAKLPPEDRLELTARRAARVWKDIQKMQDEARRRKAPAAAAKPQRQTAAAKPKRPALAKK
ncbi:MAG: hypothetical protein C4524_11395 [Candidatus Zixiibacteriota bacterium]|nr:MAG: hypothetical protein C4524_11395 [candidate division Zixibacteria bacterium]